MTRKTPADPHGPPLLPDRRTVLTGGAALMLAGAAPPVRTARAAFPDPSVFPIGVWLQDPRNAVRWQAAGINIWVGLWQGPTRSQLETLAAVGMRVIAAQTDLSLEPRWRDTVVGWFSYPDEPDNAQPLPGGGFGAPVPPGEMQRRYREIRRRDPSRPVYLNLGQGVAWDGWYGRGSRTHHPEDYTHYAAAADIISFDIYPVTSPHAPVAGRIELIGHGVQRLRSWAGPGRTIWAVIGASRIDNPDRAPDAAEIRAQAWMAVIHGAQGLIWFAHQFRPRFVEAAALEDPVARAALAAVNAEIATLAPVLNGGTPAAGVRAEAGLAIRALDYGGALHVLAIRTDPRSGPLRIGLPPGTGAGVDLATGAPLRPERGMLQLDFAGYEPRLMRFPTGG